MLKRYAAFFSLSRSILDATIIAAVWILAYVIRFKLHIFSTPKGMPDINKHLILTVPVTIICYLSCLVTGLYKTQRIRTSPQLLADTFKGTMLSTLFILAFLYYLQSHPYSRKLLGIFVVLLFSGLIFSHILTMKILGILRTKGYNLRHYVVLGAGKKGQELVQSINKASWFGLKCRFFVDDNPARIGTEILGVPVYGPIEKLNELINPQHIDEVYVALNENKAQKTYPLLEKLQLAGITIRIIPNWGNLTSISTAIIVNIGPHSLFSYADSPLTGANTVLKELFDRIVAAALLTILAVPMAVISLLVKLTSKGPILYTQTRVGMDQKQFKMKKFRTMTPYSEDPNNPQWSRPDNPRRTTIGRWLRRTGLDELPQLVNVIKGDMSLVGPRPEQPYFVKQFSEEYKKYMLRHKVKAGITGWAQIHGFRGDTSLKKRLQYDLYYIRNWSLGLDIRILLLTPWYIIKGRKID